MKPYEKAMLVLNKKSVGSIFFLKWHYKTYRFKTEVGYCLLTHIGKNTASFLIESKLYVYDIYDEDIILYAKKI